MASAKGCFKNTLLGCLGLIAIAVIFGAIMAGLAWKDRGKGGQVEQEVSPTVTASEAVPTATVDPALLTTRYPGRVILDLGQGEFQINPAAPGAGLSARARFDSEVHTITESYEVRPDSSWVYQLGFHQTMPGLQALFRALMGNDTDARIEIFLPPDVPIELVVGLEQGGGEAELGGLWVTTADFSFKQGGFVLGIREPLREPMDRLRLHGRMGGVELERLGNASPRVLDIDCGMGGADVDLRGAWRNDCDAHLAVKMGGLAVSVPRDMIVVGDRELASTLARTDTEVPQPTLRLTVEESMGEVEVKH